MIIALRRSNRYFRSNCRHYSVGINNETEICRHFPHSEIVGGVKSNITRAVKVAIIGIPNSGKSTLINRIVDRKVCAASKKVHTTRKTMEAVCTELDTQIIFLDTPGVVTDSEQKRYSLPKSMTEACQTNLNKADIVGVIQDVSNPFTREMMHPQVLEALSSVQGIPSFLVLNKVDVLRSKRKLLDLIRILTNGLIAGKPVPGSRIKFNESLKGQGYSLFSDVFMISALIGDGVKDLKNYLIKNAKSIRDPNYSREEWSDQTHESLIEEATRAKLLDFLPQEIPYKLKAELEYYEFDDIADKVTCIVAVQCPSERIALLIRGAAGGRLKQIQDSLRLDLLNMLKTHVSINLYLKVQNKVVE